MADDRPLESYDSGTRALIEDLLAKPSSFDRNEILSRARRLRYHSFADGAYAAPEIELVKHLKAAGYKDLVQCVVEGKYDQPPSESKKWAEETAEGREMSAMVMADPELQRSMTAALEAMAKIPKDRQQAMVDRIAAKKPWKSGS